MSLSNKPYTYPYMYLLIYLDYVRLCSSTPFNFYQFAHSCSSIHPSLCSCSLLLPAHPLSASHSIPACIQIANKLGNRKKNPSFRAIIKASIGLHTYTKLTVVHERYAMRYWTVCLLLCAVTWNRLRNIDAHDRATGCPRTCRILYPYLVP
jgi:hypothetical protein